MAGRGSKSSTGDYVLPPQNVGVNRALMFPRTCDDLRPSLCMIYSHKIVVGASRLSLVHVTAGRLML